MKRPGFTLIELLISISIFSLLSSFVVANYRSNEKAKRLKNQAQLIVSGLEKAQNMALTGELAGGIVPLSYYFKLEDCSGGCSYGIFAETTDEDIPVSSVSLSNLTAETSDGLGQLLVNFTAPRGRMLLPENREEVGLSLNNSDNDYCVRINSVSGRIDSFSGECP